MKTRFPSGWRWAACALAVMGLCGTCLTRGEGAPPTWPKSIDTPQGRCTVFQPQPTALEGERLTARAALAVASGQSTNMVFGIAQLQARLVPNPERKQATVSEITLSQAKFAPADATAMAGLADALKPELAKLAWTVASDELQAGLDAVERERAAARGINTNPPRILYSATPAVLVMLDGAPELRALTNSPLMRVVNTPYAMVFQPAEKRYWLQGSYEWFTAPDWRGEWTPAGQAPAEVLAAVPKGVGTNAPALGSRTGPSPRIVVSSEPAELVVTRGEPTYTPVDGSELLYVSNSDQLLFLTIDTREYYVAFAGRWYRSAGLMGPWDTVAPEKLPPPFARIPPGSPKSEALTYVAGTVEAEDAVLQASIPQVTAVERDHTVAPVKYDGAPQFTPVESTGVQYSTNTVDAVFLVRDRYYMCRDAVWYTGIGPEGPWSVATAVPPEIQSLPPSNPHYNVKYVYVYGSTPEEVYVGYAPGYSGCYVYGPTVVYGTGWWYPGYYGPSYCWAYPATFGFGFGYSSWGGWSVGFGFGYGWLGCGYGWGWGGYYPGGWWGPCGAYWACAPRYPCYDGNHSGNNYHGDAGGGKPPPPGSGTRSEVRKDAPSPADRGTNPQRRTLPSYARTAKASYQPPSALRSARGIESGSGTPGSPARSTASMRTAVVNGSAPGSQTASASQGAGASPPSRSAAMKQTDASPNTGPRVAGAPNRSATAPVKANAASQSSAPGARAPAQPGRATAPAGQRTSSPSAGNWPGARPNAVGALAPAAAPQGRAPTSPAPPVYARTPVSAAAPARSAPGVNYSYAPSVSRSSAWSRSPASGPAYGAGPARSPGPAYGPGPARSSAPAYGSASRGPGMGSSMSAPSASMRGGAPPSFSAPSRSAPSFSGGSMSRGGSARGR